MPDQPSDPDFLRHLRARYESQGPIFWIDDHQLALFDGEAAVHANKVNYAHLTLHDRLVDVVRRRPSRQVSWRQLRSAWLARLRVLSRGEHVVRLWQRVDTALGERCERDVDLVWAIHEATIDGLLPIVIAGLPPRDMAIVKRDIRVKLVRLLSAGQPPKHRSPLDTSTVAQMRGGLAVRRELRARAAGRRPFQGDLTDPIVHMLPMLGMDRAVDAVTAVLTAIAGPPGATAASVTFELARRPEWSGRLSAELAALTPRDLADGGPDVAPVTHRFVKEVLRFWSAPVLLTRGVRAPINLPQVRLDVGQRFLLSPYVVHHDPAHWSKPDEFDPDRWLPDAPHGCPGSAHYVPFGWRPKSCIGSGLGLINLVLLCHLLCTRYRVEPRTPEAMRMVLAAVPMPFDFHGRITRRSEHLPTPPG